MDYPSPTISVVIPVYNGGEAFRTCLGALLKATPPPEEILVVSDGSTDGSAEFATSLGVPIIRRGTRGGPAQARNQGARAAMGEVLLFLDSDVLAPYDVIGRVRALFDRDPRCAAIFGSYDNAPAENNFLSQYKNLLHHYVHQTGRTRAFTFWAGCGAIRRDVFLALGGFDESYSRPSIEDIELGCRLNAAGHTVALCKELQVKHLKRWGAWSLLKSDVMDRAFPWAQLILREGALPDDLNLRITGRWSAVLAWILAWTLVGSVRNRVFLLPAAIAAAILWLLNAPLYAFFYRRRGFVFMLRAAACHWLYYLYSSGTFAAAAVRHLFRNGLDRAMKIRKAASLGRF